MLELHPPAWLREHAPAWMPETAATEAAGVAAYLQLTGLRAGMDALDVGCGDGAVTCVMSTIVGPGRVTGVDSNRARVAQARARATERGIEIEYLAGGATRLPLAAASFDYTWARLGGAGLAQPARVLAELVRVTRPGGRVVVGELDGASAQRDPLAPTMTGELGEASWWLRANGGNAGVGRKLAGWCAQAGLHELAVQTLPFYDCTLILVQGTVLGIPGL